MSELEYDINVYAKDSENLKATHNIFADIQAQNYPVALLAMKEKGLKQKINLEDLFNVDLTATDKHLRISFATWSHGDEGLKLIKFLGKISEAIMVHEDNNQIGEEEVYGYISGRKRKLAGLIKGLKDYDQDVALHEAVRNNRIGEVKKLLSHGANSNSNLEYPLHILSVLNEKPETLELLLKAGADTELVYRKDGRTLLGEAAAEKDSIYISLALQYGAAPNRVDSNDITPLMKACDHGIVRNIELLLAAGAEVNKKDSEGKTALVYACQSWTDSNDDQVTIMKLLLDSGADPNTLTKEGKPVIAFTERTTVEQLLLGAGAQYYTPLSEYNGRPEDDIFVAIRYNHSEKFMQSLQQGLDLNSITDENEWTPLRKAIRRPAMLKQLILSGADPHLTDDRGEGLLHYAGMFGCQETITILLNSGLDINMRDQNQDTPLHNATSFGNTNTVSFLLEKGADPSITNDRGKTPFEKAINPTFNKDRVLELIEVFIQHGALEKIKLTSDFIDSVIWENQNQIFGKIIHMTPKDNFGKYLCKAVRYENLEAFNLLLDGGADVNYQDEHFQRSTLSDICMTLARPGKERREIMREMFSKVTTAGADVNSPEKGGITPIFYLQGTKGLVDETKKLLSLGAEINIQAEGLGELINTYYEAASGLTPLMIAAAKGLEENVALLLEAGADHTFVNEEGTDALGFAENYRKKNVAKLLKNWIEQH